MLVEKIRRHRAKPKNKRGVLGRKMIGRHNIMRCFRSRIAELASRDDVEHIYARQVQNIWRHKPPSSPNLWFGEPQVFIKPKGPKVRLELCAAQATQEIEISFSGSIEIEACLALFG
jgi:hypothetical protein